jgi:hypothetical protein
MSAERNSLGGAPRKGWRSLTLPPVDPTTSLAAPSKRLRDSFARPLIPAGPACALAIPPLQRQGAVS